MSDKLNYFICPGTIKSGTTTLYDILIQHPEIVLTKEKETPFFSNDKNFNKGKKYYDTLFHRQKNESLIKGEINPTYFIEENVPSKIYKLLGKDTKLVFLLRNPIDRAYSHYWMMVKKRYDSLNFSQALDAEKDRIGKSLIAHQKFSYIQNSLYFEYLKKYLKYFPIKNMFFIIFENDFSMENRLNTVNHLFKFLNLREDINVKINIKSNPSRLPKYKLLHKIIYREPFPKNLIKSIIPIDSRNKLLSRLETKFDYPKLEKTYRKEVFAKYFETDIKNLENAINRDLSVWYNT